jgi:translation elongation factor EF-4
VNVERILQLIIEKIPPPTSKLENPFKALLFDSWYDQYKGVICLMAIIDGMVKKGKTSGSQLGY